MSFCPVDYPSEPPIECAMEMARIVRAGKLVEERARFARHAWNVQGYLQRVIVGQPIDAVGQKPFATAETIGALESLADDARPSNDPVAQSNRWSLLALLLRWVLEQLLASAVSSEG